MRKDSPRTAVPAIVTLAVVAALIGAGCGSSTTKAPVSAPPTGQASVGPLATPAAAAAATPSAAHVVVIVMENQASSDLAGNPSAPWITHAAKTYGYAANYFSVGYPSQSDYIALTSGSTQGVFSDHPVTLDAHNIVDELEGAGLSWKAYIEGLPADKLAPSSPDGRYGRQYDPFVSYRDIQTNPSRMANVVDLSSLAHDLQAGSLPAFAWITPDQCHDMHGITGTGAASAAATCGFAQSRASLIRAGDEFLATWVPRILASPSWTPDSVLFVTWDESNGVDNQGCCDATPGGGRVLALAITQPAVHVESTVAYNHYSLLATVERLLGLACLGNTCDTRNVRPMLDLLPPR